MTRRCVLVFDHWFVLDGRDTFTSPGNYQPELLAQRYLNAFDELLILGRCRGAEAGSVLRGGTSDSIRLLVVATKGGPIGALSGGRLLWRSLPAPDTETSVILVLPGLLGSMASALLRRRSYGVEVVGNAGESLAVLRKNRHLTRLWSRLTARAVRRAAGVAYVSPELRHDYPPGPGAVTANYSSIMLHADAMKPSELVTVAESGPIRLVTVARLTQPYKGIDVLLAVVARLGDGFELDIVGGGPLLDGYRALARELDVHKRVHFHGNLLQGEPVRRVLDGSDLYVQPSLTEGLPRAVIEAMARGLPCIATRVGGVPGLLPDEWLVDAGSVHQLVVAIQKITSDRGTMLRAAHLNRVQAEEYLVSTLQPRRDNFYRELSSVASLRRAPTAGD